MKIERRRKKERPTKSMVEFLLYLLIRNDHSVLINDFAKSCIIPMGLSESESIDFLESSEIRPLSIRTLFRYSQELNLILDREFRIQISKHIGSGEIILDQEHEENPFEYFEVSEPEVIGRKDPEYVTIQSDEHLSHLYRLVILYEHFESQYSRLYYDEIEKYENPEDFERVYRDEEDPQSSDISSSQARNFLLNMLELSPSELSLRTVQRYLKEIKEMVIRSSWVNYLLTLRGI